MITTLKSTISRKNMNSQQYSEIQLICLQQTEIDDYSQFFAPAIELMAAQITENNI